MSLPSINFPHLTVSEIQPGQTFYRCLPPEHGVPQNSISMGKENIVQMAKFQNSSHKKKKKIFLEIFEIIYFQCLQGPCNFCLKIQNVDYLRYSEALITFGYVIIEINFVFHIQISGVFYV